MTMVSDLLLPSESRRALSSVTPAQESQVEGTELASGIAALSGGVLGHDPACRRFVRSLEDGDPGVHGAEGGAGEHQKTFLEQSSEPLEMEVPRGDLIVGPDVAAKFRGGWPGVLEAYARRAARS